MWSIETKFGDKDNEVNIQLSNMVAQELENSEGLLRLRLQKCNFIFCYLPSEPVSYFLSSESERSPSSTDWSDCHHYSPAPAWATLLNSWKLTLLSCTSLETSKGYVGLTNKCCLVKVQVQTRENMIQKVSSQKMVSKNILRTLFLVCHVTPREWFLPTNCQKKGKNMVSTCGITTLLLSTFDQISFSTLLWCPSSVHFPSWPDSTASLVQPPSPAPTPHLWSCWNWPRREANWRNNVLKLQVQTIFYPFLLQLVGRNDSLVTL